MPADPNEKSSYARGTVMANTTQLLADYYGRLLSWLINGELTDEFGNVFKGGPRMNITLWEVFNEPTNCHGLNASEYVKQFDAIVSSIRKNADPGFEYFC